MEEKQIKLMVDRFLNWKLPLNWNPDNGISFERFGNKGTPHQYERFPVGTNLLDATQAEGLVRHMVAESKPDNVIDLGMDDGRNQVWNFPDGTIVTMIVPSSETPITVKHAVFCFSNILHGIHTKVFGHD